MWLVLKELLFSSKRPFYQLEESLRVRMDFMLFTNFDGEVPDHSTLCRFRNLLISRGLLEKTLNNINKQLEKKGLKVEAKEGAIVDATVIESAARPEKITELCTPPKEINRSPKCKSCSTGLCQS
jgi:IS5 family transposase